MQAETEKMSGLDMAEFLLESLIVTSVVAVL